MTHDDDHDDPHPRSGDRLTFDAGDHASPMDTLPPSARIDACAHCGTARPICLYWKIHGAIACCPECTHGQGEAAVRNT